MSIYAVISGPYFPVFGLNTGEYQPETTPYLDIFHAAFESFQSFIVKNSKQHINFNTRYVTNVSFWELGSNFYFSIFKQASENSP